MDRDINLIIKCLLEAGLRPKYIAFNYVVYLLCNYSTAELETMSKSKMLKVISEHFNLTAARVSSSLKKLIQEDPTSSTQADRTEPQLKEFLLEMSALADRKLQ